MAKLKTLTMAILLGALMFVSTINVNAALQNEKQSKSYYTNLNGIKMTKTQYDNLSRAFDEDTIATLTRDMVDTLANDTNLITSSSIKYVKVNTIIYIFGNIVMFLKKK